MVSCLICPKPFENVQSELIQSEALINLLDRKGIISKKEFLEEMKRVQASMKAHLFGLICG
jgi:hypothetical protein